MTSKVLRNAAFQMMSQVVTTALSWVLLLALTGYLGDKGFGQLFFALSFAFIASVFLNLGINTFLQKEVARDSTEGQRLLAHAMSLKLGLALIVYPLIMIVGRAMGVTGDPLAAIDIIGLGFVVGSFGQTFSTYLQGEQLGWAPAAGLILEKLVVTVACVALLWGGHGLVAVAWVHLAGALISTLYTGLVLYRRVPFALGFELAQYRRIAKGAVPFMTFIVFGEIYVRVDVLMLGNMAGDDVVGWYGAAFRFYGTMLFITNIFMTTVFPAITRKFANDHGDGEAGVATRRSFNLMMLVAVPVGLGMMLVAEHLVALTFKTDNFFHTIGNLQILGLSMILVCATVGLGSALIANDKQGTWAKASIGAAALNPLLNWVFIPFFQNSMGNGGFGAAIATVITEAFMLIVAVRLMPAGIFNRSTSVSTLRALCAGLVMLLAAQPVMQLGLIPIVLVSVASYVAAVLVFRVLPQDDLHHIVHAVRNAAKRGA
ncbi:MAG: polysaccharide biosynthesis protein [Planctomycetota bacterium]|nr:MAG: polysaccharide biosynthesis protein [Planctomycetota bacterium]